MDDRPKMIGKLEAQFRQLSTLLYDTSVDPRIVDAEVAPLLDENVRFTDPWQQEKGRGKYRLGLAGFHAMFRFTLDISQVSVQLDSDGASGRAMVDGVMNLQPLGQLFTYPLRTILVYEFAVTPGVNGAPQVRIHAHEEMWSIADMIAVLPMTGLVYRRLFRPAFARGFLAASWLSARARGVLPDWRSKPQ